MKNLLLISLIILNAAACFGMEESSGTSGQPAWCIEGASSDALINWPATVAQWKKDYFDKTSEDDQKHLKFYFSEIENGTFWFAQLAITRGSKDAAQEVAKEVENFRRYQQAGISKNEAPDCCDKAQEAIMKPIIDQLQKDGHFYNAIKMNTYLAQTIVGPDFTCCKLFKTEIEEAFFKKSLNARYPQGIPTDIQNELDTRDLLGVCVLGGSVENVQSMLTKNSFLKEKDIVNQALIQTIASPMAKKDSGPKLVQFLLEQGASPQAKRDKDGKEAIEVARKKNLTEIVTLLEKALEK